MSKNPSALLTRSLRKLLIDPTLHPDIRATLMSVYGDRLTVSNQEDHLRAKLAVLGLALMNRRPGQDQWLVVSATAKSLIEIEQEYFNGGIDD